MVLNWTCTTATSHPQRQVGRVGVNERFKPAQALHDAMRWGRHEQRVAGTRAANPVLRPAERARMFVLSPTFREQDFVDFANQAQEKGKSSRRRRSPWFIAAT